MNHSFDLLTNRRGTTALKWQVKEKELPMWVADMDFPAAPGIQNAINQRAAQGVFGYTALPREWKEAYVDWWKNRHHFAMEEEWLLFCNGIVPAISSIIRKLTTTGEKILIQSPVYHMFYHCIENNGRLVEECPLDYDGKEYVINWETLEASLADPQTSMMILCNPHNPIGKIWDKETLKRLGELCARYHVLVISDEIHCDLTDPEKEYIPFASVSEQCKENVIICLAPTKTFNIAGLQTAAVAVPDPVLRHKVKTAMHNDGIADATAFAVDATIAAYREGASWLDDLREYLLDNKKLVGNFLKKELPQIKMVPAEATYLLWLDCGELPGDLRRFPAFLRQETGLFLSPGTEYRGNGDRFVRMNIACPKSLVEDGLRRLKEGVLSYMDKFS